MQPEWWNPGVVDQADDLRDQAWDLAAEGYDSFNDFRDARKKEVKVPGLNERVNFIVKMWQLPCGASWWVYFETAWPAFLDMLITLSLGGIDDVIRGIYRPRDPVVRGLGPYHRGRGGRHSRKKAKKPTRAGKAWRRARPWLPLAGEPGGALGGKIGGTVDMKGRKVTDGVRNLWRVDGVLQRLMWWWLVLEATTTFAYRWTTLLYRTEACQESIHAHAVTTHPDMALSAISEWRPLTVNQVEVENNGASTLNGAVDCPTPTADITATVTFKNESETTTLEAELTLRPTGAIAHMERRSGKMSIAPGSSRSAIINVELPYFEGAGVYYNVSHNCRGIDAAVIVIGRLPVWEDPNL